MRGILSLCEPHVDVVDAGLQRVTDSALNAFASAGCGSQLKFLTLRSMWSMIVILVLLTVWCGDGLIS